MNLGQSCLESQIKKVSSVIRRTGQVTLTAQCGISTSYYSMKNVYTVIKLLARHFLNQCGIDLQGSQGGSQKPVGQTL